MHCLCCCRKENKGEGKWKEAEEEGGKGKGGLLGLQIKFGLTHLKITSVRCRHNSPLSLLSSLLLLRSCHGPFPAPPPPPPSPFSATAPTGTPWSLKQCGVFESDGRYYQRPSCFDMFSTVKSLRNIYVQVDEQNNLSITPSFL